MNARMIIVSQKQSNRSDNMVWQVSISNEQNGTQYCSSPLKALRYCFLLKHKSGLPISTNCMNRLTFAIQQERAVAQ